MARALLIYNPAAARTRPKHLKVVCDTLSSEGWKVDAVATTRPGDETKLALEGVSAAVDVIAVYGGDGTAIRAFTGMIDSDIPLGLVRGGTGNLLATNLRLPRAPALAARTIARGTPHAIDLGRLTCGETERYFAVACGAGFDAQLMALTSGQSKRRWRMAAYMVKAWELLGNLEESHFRISVDGQAFEVKAAAVLIANCGAILPPVVSLGPGISLDDGLLDVIALSARNRLEGLSAIWRLITQSADGRGVKRARGKSITVSSDEVVLVESDGDQGGTTPFAAEVVPGRLKVMIPL
ncbi:MAG: diacylglycerol/lipid kinase family protein [Gemmatimonadales bacterium]